MSNSRQPDLNILCVGWHEAFLYNLSHIGHFFHIIEPQVMGLQRIDQKDTWQTAYRPVPKNARLISSVEQLRESLQNQQFDVALALTYWDLVFFNKLPLRKLYFPITVFHGEFADYQRINPDHQEAIYAHIRSHFANYVLGFGTSTIMEKELGNSTPGGHQGHLFETHNGIFPEDYHSYTGEIAGVLRVGNSIEKRGQYSIDFQREVLDEIPYLVLGHNPGVVNARMANDWDDLRDCLRKYRVYLATFAPNSELSDPLAQLEAMATGMPVVTMPHRGCVIVDGESGFIASDPKTLREKILLLLNDRELAVRIGENGKKVAATRYNFEKYKQEWEKILTDRSKQHSHFAETQNKKPLLEWQGPFASGTDLSKMNHKMIQALHEHVSIRPISTEPMIHRGVSPADPIDSLKGLEIFGESLLNPHPPLLRVMSPHEPALLSEGIPSAGLVECDLGGMEVSLNTALQAKSLQEIWVGSKSERNFLMACGVDEKKIFVLPRGFDPVDSNPSGAARISGDENAFGFLFLGDIHLQEGGNLALKGYLDEFHADEPVRMSYASTEKQPVLIDKIQALLSSGTFPSLHYGFGNTIDYFVTLCRGASFFLAPTRGLAFPRFLNHALGTALPIAVSGYGGPLDLQPWGSLYFIPTQLQHLNPNDFPFPLAHTPFWGNPDPHLLQQLLRYAFSHPTHVQLRGLLNRHRALSERTWHHTALRLLAHLQTPKDAPPHPPQHLTLPQLFQQQENQFHYDAASLHLLLQHYPQAKTSLQQIHHHPFLLAALAHAHAGLHEPEALHYFQQRLPQGPLLGEELVHLVKTVALLHAWDLLPPLLAQNPHLTLMALHEVDATQKALDLTPQLPPSPLLDAIQGLMLQKTTVPRNNLSR